MSAPVNRTENNFGFLRTFPIRFAGNGSALEILPALTLASPLLGKSSDIGGNGRAIPSAHIFSKAEKTAETASAAPASEERTSIIRPMEMNHGERFLRHARRIHALACNRRYRRDLFRKLASGAIRHHRSVREPGQIYLFGINVIIRDELVYEQAHKFHIINFFSRGRTTTSTGIPRISNKCAGPRSLGVHRDEAFFIGEPAHQRHSLGVLGVSSATMKNNHCGCTESRIFHLRRNAEQSLAPSAVYFERDSLAGKPGGGRGNQKSGGKQPPKQWNRSFSPHSFLVHMFERICPRVLNGESPRRSINTGPLQ